MTNAIITVILLVIFMFALNGAKMNLKRKSAEIFSKNILTEEQISKTIEKIGYNFEGCE